MQWINLGAKRVNLSDGRISDGGSLTPLEVDLLRFLSERPGQVVARERLLEEVWGYAVGVQSRAVDKTINRLRKKLELDPRDPQLLRSEHGRGYMLSPPRASVLLGRGQLIAEGLAVLDRGETLALGGMAGAGKTSVALAMAKHWVGPKAWCTFPPGTRPETMTSTMHDQLGLLAPPHGTLETALRRPDLLLVLDDATDLALHLRQHLLRWQFVAPGLRVIVCSREAIGGPGICYLEVPPLSMNAAEQLFLERARIAEAGPLPKSAVRGLLAVSGTLPLVVRLAAGALGFMSLQALQDRIGGFELDLRAPGQAHSLRAILDASWPRLAESVLAALPVLAVLPGGFDLGLVEVLLPTADAAGLLAKLRQSNLVFRSPDSSRLHLHPQVRSYALQRVPLAEDVRAAMGRRLLRFSEDALGRVHGPEGMAALALLRGERSNLLSLLEDRPELAPRVSSVLQVVYKTGQPLADWAALNALALSQAMSPQDRCQASLHQASHAISASDRPEAAAALGRCLASCSAEQAPETHVLARLRQAYLMDLDGEHAAAGSELLEAAELAANASAFLKAQVCSDLGLHHFRMQELETASQAFEDATEQLLAIGEGLQLGLTHLNHGLCIQAQGDLPRAERRFQRAALLGEKFAFRRLQGLATMALMTSLTSSPVDLAKVEILAGELGSRELASLVDWKKGYACHLAGDLSGAGQAYAAAEGINGQFAEAGELGQLLVHLLDLEQGKPLVTTLATPFWTWRPGQALPALGAWPEPARALDLAGLLEAINSRG